MKRTCVSFLVVMSVISFTSAYAETYTWTDAQGTVHFTEDLGIVPVTLRKKVRTVEEAEPASSSPATAGESPAGGQTVAPRAMADTKSATADDLYGGKSYEQWQTELADSESAMTAVRNRIEEIVAKLKLYGHLWQSEKKLVAEHEALSAEFKEMKTRYYQLVESARKAGLEVNIQ